MFKFKKEKKYGYYFVLCYCFQWHVEIGDGNVILKDKEGKTFTIDTDSVILSIGYNSAPLVTKGRNVHVIGDASSVGNLRTVIWGAWKVCMKI